jgi:hypothetical protein
VLATVAVDYPHLLIPLCRSLCSRNGSFFRESSRISVKHRLGKQFPNLSFQLFGEDPMTTTVVV